MKFTNRHNLPDRVIRQLHLPYRPKEGRISVTDLIDAPLIRTLRLERWDDIVSDYSDYLQPMLGIAVHEMQERLVIDDEQAEKKLEAIVDDVTVVGKGDVFDDEVLRDTKVTKIGYLHFNRKKLEAQINCYAWLWRKQDAPAKIHALEGDLYYKDWDWKRVVFRKQPDDYPEIMFQNVKVNLWTFEQQEQYIFEQVMYHKIASHDECSQDDKWASPTKFCVMNKDKLSGNSLRNLNTIEEAKQWIKDNNKKNVEIVKRPGGPLRCLYFCALRTSGLCPYMKK